MRRLHSDVRLRIAATDRSTYADVFVVCAQETRAADDPDAIANPVLIGEILSPMTERSDRGEKFAHDQAPHVEGALSWSRVARAETGP
ncbi:MAG: Uma2 family endonuclease [Myxococcota bacterium]|jgi:Uma2 family endonuclease